MPTPKDTIVVTSAQLAEGFPRQRRRGEVHRRQYDVLEDLGEGACLVRKPIESPSTAHYMVPKPDEPPG